MRIKVSVTQEDIAKGERGSPYFGSVLIWIGVLFWLCCPVAFGRSLPLSNSAHEITHVPSLGFHPSGLGLDVASRLFQEPSLPNHRYDLQHANYRQDSCKPFDFPLYGEILAALL